MSVQRGICLLLIFATLLLGACGSVAYYFQSIDGHMEVMRRSVPFDEVATTSGSNEALSRQLKRVTEIRDFASRELGLPDNRSYRLYADLGRPFVVWNVVAAPELSIRPMESCFLFAGCVTYRGFYVEENARNHANELAAKGLDTYVSGVPAYSTLGWFDDPVLSTFIHYPEADIARIIFHELAHQVVYVRDDTQFNESFAVAVEQEGVRRWLAKRQNAESNQELLRWQLARSRRVEVMALLLQTRRTLEEVFASPMSDTEKRNAKQREFERMAENYARLKNRWNGFSGYDRFFSTAANNALLASVAVYSDLVPAFTRMIDKHAGDMGAFYREVREIARLDKAARNRKLRAYEASSSKGWPKSTLDQHQEKAAAIN
ncbi:MAG: aminopeptidase [Burkholderiales bacterium]